MGPTGGSRLEGAARRGWMKAGAAARGSEKRTGERSGKERPMIQVRSQGSRPGEGTGVWAGVENIPMRVGLSVPVERRS